MEDLMTMHNLTGAHGHDTEPLTPPPSAPASEQLQSPEQQSRKHEQEEGERVSLPPSPPPTAHSHTRSQSLANPARKRLSLPIAPLSPVPSYTTSPIPRTPATAESSGSNGSTSFLTALAAQERRVLELREELTRAEGELFRLKREWTRRERAELRVNTGGALAATGLREDELREKLSSPTTREEWEKRMANGGRGTDGKRKVIGGRHQRTLSLLSSPDRTRPGSAVGVREDVEVEAPKVGINKRHTMATFPSYSAPFRAGPDLEEGARTPSSTISSSRPLSLELGGVGVRGPPEQLLRTGKQLADDLKEGLWTFLEDLRQAAVGDDQVPRNIPAPAAMKRSESNTARKGSGSASSSPKKETSQEESLIDFSDAASARPFRWSSSTTLSDTHVPSGSSTPRSRASTPRTSTSSIPAGLNLKTDGKGKGEDVLDEESALWNALMSPTTSQLRKKIGEGKKGMGKEKGVGKLD